MKLKRILFLSLIFIFLFSISVLGIDIEIDGSRVKFTEQTGYPFIDANNRTQVPLRVTMETFGAKVAWEQQNNTAIVEKSGIRIEVPIGEDYILKNGKIINNDTAAIIIGGRVYLPIRVVLESFLATVDWNNVTNAVEAKSNDDILNKIETLNKKISYIYDERLFTLFAFMNYTGYNDENNKAGMHPVRVAIRNELNDMNLKLSDNKYYENKAVSSSQYINALRSMGDAPNFKYLNNKYPHDLSDLNISLKEFYNKANIHDLYLKYKDEYDRELEEYKDNIQEPLINTIDFLKINVEDIDELFIQVNLLDAYERGSGLGAVDAFIGQGITTGPSYEPNVLNIVHEFLHGVFNPIVDKYPNVLSIGEKNMELIKDSTAYNKYRYTDWGSIVKESFVRAISSYFTMEDPIFHCAYETENGFIMTEYILNRFINEYDSYNGSLNEFVVMLMREFKFLD